MDLCMLNQWISNYGYFSTPKKQSVYTWQVYIFDKTLITNKMQVLLIFIIVFNSEREKFIVIIVISLKYICNKLELSMLFYLKVDLLKIFIIDLFPK